jgi:hypothetical protein
MAKFKVSKYGQWEYPGQPTAVPTEDGRITMQGVPYPVMGFVPGQPPIIMQPGGNYQFPGKMVYEIPMAYGGDISIPDLSRPNWLDKAQKGQQVKYYDDYSQYLQAEKAKTDSMADYLRDKERYMSSRNYTTSDPFPYDVIVSLADLNENTYGYRTPGYSPKPTVKPKLDQQAVMQQISKNYPGYSIKFDKNKIFIRQPRTDDDVDNGIFPVWHPLPIQKKKSKPQEYIPTKTVKLEREPIELVMPQSDRTLENYNNTLQVLRSIQQEDRDKQTPRVVPAPNFRYGGWLDKYQEGTQVKANLLGYNPEIGPTVKNAQLLQEQKLQEAVRNSRQLPSGAIQPTLGPIEYMLLPGLAGSAIKKAMEPKAHVDTELEAIRKILRKNVTYPKQTGPLTETPPWPNRFLELGDDAWTIGNMERGRTSVPNPDIDLPGKLPKPTPKRLPGVNGTSYPDRLPKQKYGGWLDNY